MTVLVTGGLGFIGSHICIELMKLDERFIVLDDLSTNSAVISDELRVKRDLGDVDGLARDFVSHGVTEIIHLAGKKNVTESIADPSLYIHTNVGLSANILSAAIRSSVETIIFSSSCSVYGETASSRVIAPESPYAASKRSAEVLLHQFADMGLIKVVSLRYFNAAGSSDQFRIGERSDISKNLIPRLARAALSGEPFELARAAGETPDGTCIRDYVHVDDLARAHVAALHDARATSTLSEFFDLGSGTGATTLEVLRAVELVVEAEVNFSLTPPRPGDPTSAVAPLSKNTRLPNLSSWQPVAALDQIVSTAIRWHSFEIDAPRDRLPDLSNLEGWETSLGM